MNVIDITRVAEKTTLGRSTIYAYVKEGRFPPSVRMGDRHVAWVESEVDEWVAARVTESRAARQEVATA